MFAAVEAFFFHRSNELPVKQQETPKRRREKR